ncbi:hypothetical protein N1030_13780 [Desulfovibrio mangrovi]|uniref:hypothetical protein n=1 Tax=Desulfovibrio mangrovi TaxID=2976983 RepID=UPI0022467607|nr:hypothetical protein [Desulfovibrio mangrovi]UZP66670.1 hypothetical protein N1030_13780 [Desulfovibrio mangrovi]
MKSRVVIVVGEYTHLHKAMYLAGFLVNKAKCDVTVVAEELPKDSNYSFTIVDGVDFVDATGWCGPEKGKIGKLLADFSSIVKNFNYFRLFYRLWKASSADQNIVKTVMRWAQKIENVKKQADTLYRKKQFDVIVIAKWHSAYSPVWAVLGERYKAPVVAFLQAATTYERLRLVTEKDNTPSSLVPLASHYLPNFVGKKYFSERRRLPLYFAHLITGLSQATQWRHCSSSLVSAFFLESQYAFEHFKAYFEKTPVVVTGDPQYDMIAESDIPLAVRRERYFARFGFLEELKLLVASPPKDYISVANSDEFKTYEELLDCWLSSLKKLRNYNVLISLHPRLSEQVKSRFVRAGFAVVYMESDQWLPVCDALLVDSGTVVKLARALGKIVVCYSICGTPHIDDGVLLAQTGAELAECLDKIDRPELLNELSKKAYSGKNYWGESGQSNANIWHELSLLLRR